RFRHSDDLVLELDVVPHVVVERSQILVGLERIAGQVRCQVGESALVHRLELSRRVLAGVEVEEVRQIAASDERCRLVAIVRLRGAYRSSRRAARWPERSLLVVPVWGLPRGRWSVSVQPAPRWLLAGRLVRTQPPVS